ncbi:MAG: c-type cytochrome [Steroidobacteraceae bacterium]
MAVAAATLLVVFSLDAAEPDAAAPAATASPDLARGKRLFLQCRACHELKARDSHKVGPNLHGVLGTRAASAPDFQFSEALKKSGITWTEQTMNAWLARPTDVVPGTIMAYAGLANDADRRALIAYLAAETR